MSNQIAVREVVAHSEVRFETNRFIIHTESGRSYRINPIIALLLRLAADSFPSGTKVDLKVNKNHDQIFSIEIVDPREETGSLCAEQCQS